PRPAGSRHGRADARAWPRPGARVSPEGAAGAVTAEPIVRGDHVTKFFGTLKVLDDVSIDVARGERLVVIGPSGSGKSTLLRCINGLEPVSAGRVVVDGMTVGD